MNESNKPTYNKPSKQDRAYALTALELARIAANALEEMEHYLENIENETLREQTAAEIKNLVG